MDASEATALMVEVSRPLGRFVAEEAERIGVSQEVLVSLFRMALASVDFQTWTAIEADEGETRH